MGIPMDKPKVIKLGSLRGNSQGYRVYDSRGVCVPITTNGGVSADTQNCG